MSAADAVRTTLRGVGQTLITLGVVVLLFCVYELQVTNLVTAREQDRLGDELAQAWAREPARTPAPGAVSRPVPGAVTQPVPGAVTQPAPGAVTQPASAPLAGDAFARLHVPALSGWRARTLVEGVGVADLKKGPGHIPGTALPGQLGNVVLSGHRTTYGAPFKRWDELDPGEQVVLETRDSWFTYTITGSQVVSPNAIEVTYPVPGDRRATPTRRLLTMTTCNPEYSAKQRLIVSAELTATGAKAAGLPPALQGA